MKKRIIALVLVIAMMLLVLSATAETFDTRITMESGYATVTWTGGNAGNTYYLFTQCLDPVTGGEQPMNYNGTGTFYTCKLEGIIPGHSYDIYLVNTDLEILDMLTYTAPSAVVFEDGKLKDTSVKVTIEPRKMLADGTIKSLSELTAANIGRDLGNESAEYGFKFTMKMPQLIKSRSFHMQIAVTAPNGMVAVNDFGDVEFSRVADGYQTLWSDFTGSIVFSDEYDAFGAVPSGKYTVELYWDGMLVNRQTLKLQ